MDFSGTGNGPRTEIELSALSFARQENGQVVELFRTDESRVRSRRCPFNFTLVLTAAPASAADGGLERPHVIRCTFPHQVAHETGSMRNLEPMQALRFHL